MSGHIRVCYKSGYKLPFDRDNEEIILGDSVRIIEIPACLLDGLPEEDQIAIRAQLGKVLIVEGFGEDGSVELEFIDIAGAIHFIWIAPRCLEKT